MAKLAHDRRICRLLCSRFLIASSHSFSHHFSANETMAASSNDIGSLQGSSRRATLLAATRAIGLFLLIRFVLVHATVVYLAITRPAAPAPTHLVDGNATSLSDGGGEQVQSTTDAATAAAKLNNMKNKNKRKEPKPPPEPIIKTVTKKVVQKRKMTTLTDTQRAKIEIQMAKFKVPPLPSSAGKDGNYADSSSSISQADQEELTKIESTLKTMDGLTAQLNDELLPQVRRSRTALRSDVDGIRGDIRGSDNHKRAAVSPARIEDRKKRYSEMSVATLLKELVEVYTYKEWKEEELKAKFEGLMEELVGMAKAAEEGVLSGDGGAIMADLGSVISTILGKEEDDGSSKAVAGAAVKVCDPAFLSREVPEGCRDGEDGGATVAASCIVGDNIARESDLFAVVGSIEEVLRDRTGRFSGILSGSTEEEKGSVGPLTDNASQHRFKKAVNRQVAGASAMVNREEAAAAERKKDIEVQREEEEVQEEEEEVQEEEDKICATERDVEYLMDEGLDAIHRKKHLREELVSALRLLYDERGEEFDGDAASIDWWNGKEMEQGPKSTPHPDWTHAADASFAHRGSFRTLIDTPLFHDVMDKLDCLADAVGGYNEGIDRVIDFVAGDERDGSVSKTVKKAVLNAAGRIPIPPQYYQWREKAGVLA